MIFDCVICSPCVTQVAAVLCSELCRWENGLTIFTVQERKVMRDEDKTNDFLLKSDICFR